MLSEMHTCGLLLLAVEHMHKDNTRLQPTFQMLPDMEK